MPLACVVTNGGPLIALPRGAAAAWRGTSPPLDAEVPPGWTWGDGIVCCDYDRACDPPERSFEIDDSFSTWPIAVGDSVALVLDGEIGTTAVQRRFGVVIVRDCGLMSESDVDVMLEGMAAELIFRPAA